MLHVFKDSPFNFIDKNRIFSDYIDWIQYTIDIIKNSKEKWLMRMHPSAKNWGENQKNIINNLLGKKYTNIFVDENNFTNVEIFKKTKRLVTYSGTSHLEVAIYGVKPIIISETIGYRYLKNSVHKPKTLEDYTSLLLSNSSSKKFQLDKKLQFSLKQLLYIQENIMTFKNSLETNSIYRNTSKKLLDQNFTQISKNLPKTQKFLRKLGKKLSSGLRHTLSDLVIDSF